MISGNTDNPIIAAKAGIPELRRIDVSNLRADTVAEFDLYILTEGGASPILYRSKGLSIAHDSLNRLTRGDVREIYVDAKDEAPYFRYVESNLRSILSDSSVGTAEKAELMYGTATNLLKDAFSDPRTTDIVGRGSSLVTTTVECLLNDPNALRELLKVASFDYYTYTHSVKVFTFSVTLAMRLDLCHGDTLLEFGMGTLLHDIGKYQVDSDIVNCQGKLSQAQWEIMRRHPEFGYEILRERGLDSPLALDVVRHHHEKFSGRGYPDNLVKDQIKPMVRVCSIADIFDALTTRRSYKSAVPSFPALKLMKDEMGDELDAAFFAEFVAMMGKP